jgi:dihydroorotate dehydrogenase (fumarate)
MDFDIEKLEVVSSDSWSTPADIATPLRWISILAHRVDCDLAATTGVHDGKAVIKQLLAGAAAVQVCSALHVNGFGVLEDMLDELRSWMKRRGYSSLHEFRGKLSRERSENPGAYERVQFMKRSVSAGS